MEDVKIEQTLHNHTLQLKQADANFKNIKDMIANSNAYRDRLEKTLDIMQTNISANEKLIKILIIWNCITTIASCILLSVTIFTLLRS